MARVASVDIPDNKRVEISLQYIFGIGPTLSKKILSETGVDPNTRVKNLTDDELKFTLRVSLNLSKRKWKTPDSRPSVTAFSSNEKNKIASCILNPNPVHATIENTLKAESALKSGKSDLSELLFLNKGKIIEQNYIRRIHHRILRKAGIRKIRIHPLRHTYLSLLLTQG